MTNDEIRVRYPRLIEACMWVACLSMGEAVACIRDYKAGFEYSSEAVAHYGGATAVVKRATSQTVRHYIFNRWQEYASWSVSHTPGDLP